MRAGTDELRDIAGIGVIPRVFFHHGEVGDRGNGDNCLEQFRVGNAGLQRSVTTVRPADDGELVRVGDAFFHQPPRSCSDVTDRGLPTFEAVLMVPAISISGRSAVIGLDHRIALMCKKLGKPIKAPFVARAWSAVRKHHCRQAARGFLARRQR